ncbi:Exodeoxyribonuclease V [Saliniradius amylolyticus]|uniref:RecBCD enzyme subunit RecD n=1 Tax=Saliniradius amylolyticus TaxID=2183582 RepID=A0A2S2E1W0_9ALTE|nr:exodeoxyribonuclease V subunit alpha [Saliniradius amylolyticus]AWL11635.1 Exodeoxyribonuclease V [Saliniradius amylolyticus]
MLENSVLAPLVKAGWLTPLDQGLGDFVARHSAKSGQALGVIAALVSRQLARQQVCVSINDLAVLWRQARELSPGMGDFPSIHALVAEGSDAIASADEPLDGSLQTPLVLAQDAVYLQRYWHYEVVLTQRLEQLAKRRYSLDMDRLGEQLALLFEGQAAPAHIDWQRIAVLVAATRQLSIITGGPGTGKTTTVSRLLALIQALSDKQEQRIALAAPTGKAAARLAESMVAAKARLPESMALALPEQAHTLHRLLGPLPGKVTFRHHKDNPLPVDTLVLDEASMVDLPLMTKLLEALPSHCRLILLGDHHQLASVEVGSVLGDICQSWYGMTDNPAAQFDRDTIHMIQAVTGYHLEAARKPVSLLQNHLVRLHKSHRFDADSGISQLAQAVNDGQFETLSQVLTQNHDDIHWYSNPQVKQLLELLGEVYPDYFRACQRRDIRTAFQALSQIQVLCATRKGPWGMEQLNLLIEQHLAKQGWIKPQQDFYTGRPVMVTQNNYRLNRFNGDVGIVMPDEDGLIKVWFQRADGGFENALPSRVPAHDTLYAMTIHKSQGSEFSHAVLCLPKSPSPILSRELLYTGITRARDKMSLFAGQGILQAAVDQPCQRGSGLTIRLAVNHPG